MERDNRIISRLKARVCLEWWWRRQWRRTFSNCILTEFTAQTSSPLSMSKQSPHITSEMTAVANNDDWIALCIVLWSLLLISGSIRPISCKRPVRSHTSPTYSFFFGLLLLQFCVFCVRRKKILSPNGEKSKANERKMNVVYSI